MTEAPNPEWTQAEITQAIALRQKGLGYNAIAKQVGRSKNACATKLRRLDIWAPDGGLNEPVKEIKLRPCMCCRRSFPSEGKHHRLCGDCRQKSNPDFGSPGFRQRPAFG